MPSRLVFGVGPPDWPHFAVLVRMSVLLVLPGLAGLEGKFPFEIGKALDGFSLFPREFEIDVLKLVVKADLARCPRVLCRNRPDQFAPNRWRSCTLGRARHSRKGRSLLASVRVRELDRATLRDGGIIFRFPS